MHLCVREGGRLVVMSYHSLEDRRVKNVMRGLSPGGEGRTGTGGRGNGINNGINEDSSNHVSAFDIQGQKDALTVGSAVWGPLFKKAKVGVREGVREGGDYPSIFMY